MGVTCSPVRLAFNGELCCTEQYRVTSLIFRDVGSPVMAGPVQANVYGHKYLVCRLSLRPDNINRVWFTCNCFKMIAQFSSSSISTFSSGGSSSVGSVVTPGAMTRTRVFSVPLPASWSWSSSVSGAANPYPVVSFLTIQAYRSIWGHFFLGCKGSRVHNWGTSLPCCRSHSLTLWIWIFPFL